MKSEPCYFYVEYSDTENGRIWPLCQACGQLWPGAMLWTGNYGPWEIRCHNPICPTLGGKLIWDGVTDSDMP